MSWLSPAALSVIWVRRKTNTGRMDQRIAPAHPCAKFSNRKSIERTTVVARSRRGLR